ncbi:hypothetical protein H2200_009132 [Cladophialophora chaetospira]|uniref:Cupin 2 conserved barrel domain-containing protein n=1 Tax=Cladophialophora chaetospira TaxID=386627 RepID=A0AA38X3I9_9EURO|nr:hypothetical protein H2200_009132 [Cladophialophora chaetospira]
MPPTPATTSSAKSFTLLLPAGLVTFTFPPPEAYTTGNARTRITIPKGSTWSPGAHWHEHYTEHIRVLQGRLKLTLNGVVSIKGPEDGVVTFQKFEVHDFCRADGGAAEGEGDDGDVVVEEWTDPEDGFKEVFFYNVMSAFADPSLGATTSTNPPNFTVPLLLQLLTTIPYVDNYVDLLPFLPNSASLVGRVLFGVKWMLTHGFYAIGGWVGWAAGYHSWVREYTPPELWIVAERGPIPRGEKGGKGD